MRNQNDSAYRTDNRRKTIGTSLITIALLALLVGLAPPIQAQPASTSSYSVHHLWRVVPLTPQTGPPTVIAIWYDHTWAWQWGPWMNNWAVDPPQPNPAWAPLGEDLARLGFPPPWLAVPAPVLNRRAPWAPYTIVTTGGITIPMPAGGGNSWNATATVPNANATARSSIFVFPTTGPFYPLLGLTQCSGAVTAGTATCQVSEAYSFAYTSAAIRGYTGRIFRFMWGPRFAANSARASARRPRRVRDPIDFAVLGESAGDTLDTGTLLSIEFEFGGEDVDPPEPVEEMVEWDNNLLTMSGRDLTFRIAMDATYVDSGWGELLVQIEDSLVVHAEATGVFEMILLPSVNDIIPVTIPLDTTMTFTADLSAVIGIDPPNVELYLSQSYPDTAGGLIHPTRMASVPPPAESRLGNAHPNPFNALTSISYRIEEPGDVSLRVFDVAGHVVRTLVNEYQVPTPDGHRVDWDGTDETGQPVGSGVYFYRLDAGRFSETKKMTLLK